MKDFNEFRAMITNEYVHEWSKEIMLDRREINLPIDANTVNQFIGYIGDMNIQLTFRILREYHDWLNQNQNQS